MRTLFLTIVSALLLSSCAPQSSDAVRVIMATSAGDITLEIYPDKAPVTATNFLQYVDERAYTSSHFYRTTRADNDPMITVIQGGLWAPWEEGMDVEYKAPFPDIAHETTQITGILHVDGVISMARSEPGTASSEFFISVGDNPSLDFGGERNPDGQGFATFGLVVEGMDVVQTIHAARVSEGEGFEGQILAEPVEIISVKRVSDE